MPPKKKKKVLSLQDYFKWLRASEITAIGVTINYSIVDMSDKGAFTLTGSSKMGRAWFIGAKSFLFLGASPIPYDCN